VAVSGRPCAGGWGSAPCGRRGSAQDPRVQLRLVVVPETPAPEDALQRPVAHRVEQDRVDAVAQGRVRAVEHADVVPHGHGLGMRDEAALAPHRLVREHVVEQHGIEASQRQVAVRMHVIVVRHRHNAAGGLGVEENLVRDRAAERADASAAQVVERPDAQRVGGTHRQDLAELVVGHGDRQRRAPRRRVFDPAQADDEVAALHRRVNGCELDRLEARTKAQLPRDERRDVRLEAHDAGRIARVGLDVGRAALGVPAPDQFGGRRRRLRCGARG
jgi:hypothetical protein